MKLHQITVRNINSLYGDQSVDLDEDLLGASLFLVVGATGAGKSTLLDAASLALFGETPRLNKARSTATEFLADDDPRRVMSWGTADCLAEVIFSKVEGIARARYRARWSCSRARGKPDGRVQEPQRSMERWQPKGAAWQLVAGGKRSEDYQPAFDLALEQMDRAEFERRILLAQGRFAAFVHADPKERAAMLERLTGAEQFARVGRAARERHREVVERHREAKAKTEGVRLLEVAERAALDGQVTRLASELAAAKALEASRGAVARWLAEAVERLEQVQEAGEAAVAQGVQERNAQPDLARLAEHERCRVARERQRRAGDAQRACAALAETIHSHQVTLAALLAAQKEADKVAQGRTAELQQQRKDHTGLSQQIATARQRRQEAAVALGEWEKVEDARLVAAAARVEADQRCGDAQTALSQAQDGLTAAQQACAAAADGEKLAPHLSGLQTLRGAWQQALAAVEQRRKVLASAEAKAEHARREQARLATTAAELARAASAAQATLGQRAAELTIAGTDEALPVQAVIVEDATRRARTRRQALDADQAHTLAALALIDKRDALRAGEACPVCGSLEHPSADDGAGREHDDRLRQDAARISGQLAAIELARDALDTAREAATAAQREADAADGEAKVAAAQAAGARDQAATAATALGEAVAAVDQAHKALLAALPDLEPTASAQDIEATLGLAAERVGAWTRALAAYEAAKTRLNGALPEQVAAQEAHKTALAAEAAALAEVKQRGAQLAQAQERVAQVLQGQDPQVVEAAANAALQAAEKGQETAAKAASAAGEALREAQGVAKRQAEELDEKQTLQATLQRALDDTLAEFGVDLPTLATLTLNPVDEQAISAKKRELEAARTRVDTLLAERQRALLQQQESRPEGAAEAPDRAQSELAQQAHMEAKTGVEALGPRYAESFAKQQHDDAQQALVADLRQELVAAETALQLWTRLNRLIGHNNGQAFRDFAMTLTLQQLVDIANHHMRRLSPRYTLAVDRDKDGFAQMGFAVVDAWQADRHRSVTTLSGGETFLASLALALGLAGLSTATMPVETLLLDEGFGTLDGDTLDMAMAALAMLQADGVQVGIISHVEALKAHVPAQVVVEAVGDGRSVLRIGG